MIRILVNTCKSTETINRAEVLESIINKFQEYNTVTQLSINPTLDFATVEYIPKVLQES